MRPAIALGAAVVTAALAAPLAAPAPLAVAGGNDAPTSTAELSAPGPHAVGVTTVTLVDHGREDPHIGGPRTLLTEIWYPATDAARALPANKHSEFWQRGRNKMLNAGIKMAFGLDIDEMDERFRNTAVRDARIRDGRYPLLVFSHGNGGLRMQSLFWCEHMASHGYIVVAPDHTGNAGATVVGGRVVQMDRTAEGRRKAATARPADVSFVVDAMERFDGGADSRFTGRIDTDRTGVAGHSFGGFTSTMAADADERIKAISPWTGVGLTWKNVDVPALVVVATEDNTIKATGNSLCRRYYESHRGPRHLVEWKNAGHFSFTEMAQYRPDFGDGVGSGKRITDGAPLDYVPIPTVHRWTNAYSLAFFERYLRDRTELEGWLGTNHLPEELIVKSGSGAPAPSDDTVPTPAPKPSPRTKKPVY